MKEEKFIKLQTKYQLRHDKIKTTRETKEMKKIESSFLLGF
jgi:hypothetical protein